MSLWGRGRRWLFKALLLLLLLCVDAMLGEIHKLTRLLGLILAVRRVNVVPYVYIIVYIGHYDILVRRRWRGRYTRNCALLLHNVG